MKNFILIFCLIFALPCFAWEGFNNETGDYVKVEANKKNVKFGDIVNVLDYSTGEYKTYNVEKVNSNKLEATDMDNGDIKEFDMNDY